MLLKTNNPRVAVIESYNRPVCYKTFILLYGEVVIAFIQNHTNDIIEIYNIYYIWVNFNAMKNILYLFFAITLFGCGSDDAPLPALDEPLYLSDNGVTIKVFKKSSLKQI